LIVIAFFRRFSLSYASIALFVFILMVSTIALLRQDFRTVVSVGLLTATMIVIFEQNLVPKASLLNFLLLATIPAAILTEFLGYNSYGIIPTLAEERGFWLRISLFPSVAPSAFFALCVILANLDDEHATLRKTCLAIAMYFLIFARLRSALISLGLAVGYFLLTRTQLRDWYSAKIVYIITALIIFVGAVLMADFSNLDFGDDLNKYLFQSEEGLIAGSEKGTSYRTAIWLEHYLIAKDSPVVGVGTFEMETPYSSGSEVFLTRLYARVGLPALIFVYALFSAISHGVRAARLMPPMAGMTMLIAMLAYGSFINPYDFIFLVMAGLMAAGFHPEPPASKRGAAEDRFAEHGDDVGCA
jgi:hypothetical protein